MLLFILDAEREEEGIPEFQNISCYCLSGDHRQEVSTICISKHLMLLFISLLPSVRITMLQFQNISCSCLSQQYRTQTDRHINFKTSHVIVYRFIYTRHLVGCFISKHLMLLFIGSLLLSTRIKSKFQNISCYCLSFEPTRNSGATWIFQNISCYCLSDFHQQL